MSVIKPPITGDSTLDSWTNQITQTINAGVSSGSSPSVGARGGAGPSGFNTATISLFARTTTNSAPAAMDEQVTYFYNTASIANGSNHDGYANGIGPSDVWFRKVNAGSGDFIWTTTVSVADTNDVEIIAADSWSAVALISTSGENIKNKVFIQDNIPTALQVGDLWIDTNDNNKVYIAKSIGANEIASNEWVLAQDSVAAQARADLAMSQLGDIAADNKITPSEKLTIKNIWDAIIGEYSGIIASAADSGVATNHAKYTAYTAAYASLYAYLVTGTPSINLFQLNGSLNNGSSTHTVDRSIWNVRFKAYYDSRQGLLDFIAATLKDAADAAVTLAGTKANVFYQDASPIPTSLKVGDLWYNLDQTFNGTANLFIAQSVGANEIAANEWVRKDFVELINNNVTTIDGGHISTGSITSAQIDVGSIEANRLNINGQLTFANSGAYKFGMVYPMDGTAGIFIGNPSTSSNYTIAYQGSGSASSIKSFLVNETQFELNNPLIRVGSTTTISVIRDANGTTNVTVPTEAVSLTITAIGGGGGGGGGQSDTSNNNISGVVGVAGGTTSATVSNSLTNASASGGAGGLSGSNISAGSGTGVSGDYGTGGSVGSTGSTGGAGGNASTSTGQYGAGGGGSGNRTYGGWLNSGRDAVTNGGGGQAGNVQVTGPHDISSLGAITISIGSIGAGGAGGNGNAAGAGGTGSAGKLIVTYTTISLETVHFTTTSFGFNTVGSYAFANSTAGGTTNASSTIAGSSLRASNAKAYLSSNSGVNSMTGTWKKMGYNTSGTGSAGEGQTTLFIKIA